MSDYGYYTSKIRLDEYLYKMEYEDIDYKFASNYYRNNRTLSGSCTSFRAGNFFGRNYDWLYDYSESFIVFTPRKKNRHAVMGVAGNIPEFTKQFVESDQPSDLYKLVPFVLDGMNDSGLVVSMNVVPTDYGVNISVPRIELRHELCSKMVPRFLLDRFSNATEAVNYLINYCSIYCAKNLVDLHYEIHFIISDAFGNTYVIEVLNGKLNILREKAITNFHLSNVRFNDDGTVLTPASQTEEENAMTVNGVTRYGCGLERYNLVKKLKCHSKHCVRQLLKDLRYSNTYKKLNWFTEFVGNNLTVKSSVREYIEALIPIMDELEYKDRSDSKLWQTVHSCLYDIPNRSLELVVQENFDRIFTFIL